MADANIKLNVDTASLSQLNAELDRLNTEIKGVAVNSKEFRTLSAEIRKVDGAVESANRKLKSLDVGAVAGDLAKLGAGVASASALFKQFGEEGSSSQEAVQKALETTNTILGAGAIAEGVASAAKLAGTVATKAAAAAQSAYSLVVGTSTGALKAFRIALASTGIGLAVVAIGALVANWDKLTKAIGGSIKSNKEFREENDKLIAQLDKQRERADINIERQRILGETEAELLKQSIQANKEASDKIAEKQNEAIDRIVAARAKVRDDNSEANRKELKEAEDNSDALLVIQVKYEKERAQFRRDAVDIAIADYELEAQTRTIAAKDNELQIIQIEKDLQQKKLAELQKAGVYSLAEIQKQQNEVNKVLQEEEAYFVKVQQQKLDAEIEYLNKRAELLDVSYEERIQTLDKNYSQELDAIKRAGLDKNEIELRTQALDLQYSNDRVQIIADEEKKKLALVAENTTKRLELEKQAAEAVGDVAGVERIQKAINQIRIDTDAAVTAADTEAKTRLDQLLKTRKITEDAYKKAVKDLKQINTDFKTDITETTGEGGEAIISTAIKTLVDNLDGGLNDFLTELEIRSTKAQTDFKSNITGKSKKEVEQAAKDLKKIQDDFARQTAEATILGVNTEIDALNKLNKLTNLTTEEEEARQKKILELRLKGAKASLALAQSTADGIVDAEVEATEKVLEALNKIVEYTTYVVNALSTVNQFIQANDAIEQANFDARRARLDAEYNAKFKAIDDENKQLDDQENKKKKFATAEERRRFELAEQRAQLEEEQAALALQLQNEQLQASAQNQIDQANIGFALSVGQIVISTAEAIAKTIAQLGGVASITPPGAALIAFTGAQGAIQIAAANQARQAAISQANASLAGLSGSTVAKSGRVNKATGGLITGPGTETSDSIPVNLSNGEFVINAKATKQFLPLLQQINKTGVNSSINTSGMANGGLTQALGVIAPQIGVSELQQRVSVIEDRIGQPLKAYVVSSDITEVQNKENYISRRANVL